MSKSRERQKARRMLVQALYSWDVGGTDLETIEAEFHHDNNMTKVDNKLFNSNDRYCYRIWWNGR